MIEITAILTAAAVVYAVARLLQIPAIPLLVIAGMALAAAGLMPDRQFVIGMLEVGLAFLVFVAGTDMAPTRVGKRRGLALTVGLVQFVAMALLAGAVAFLAFAGDYSLVEVLYIALAISASSTLIVVRILRNRRQMFESFGRMVIGVLLLQDALVIGGLVVLSATTGEAMPAVVGLTATGLVVASIVIGRWIGPMVARRYEDREENLLLFVLSLLFAFTVGAYLGGVPPVAGAFCAGLALSSFPTRSLVKGLISSLNDFFLVVFFIALGALVQVPSLQAVVEGLILIGLVVVVTPILVAFVAEKAGLTSRGALKAGLVIAQTSEFSLVVAVEGMRLGQIGDDVFATIVLVTVVTMALTPVLSHERTVRWLMRFHPSPGPKEGGTTRENHVVIVGAGTAGSLLLERLDSVGQPAVIVDNDPAVVARYRDEKTDAVWGDGEDPETLEEAGVERARAVVVTTGNLHHLQEVRRLVEKETPVWLHAFEAETAEAARNMGADTITYSEVATEAFMEWFEGEFLSEW